MIRFVAGGRRERVTWSRHLGLTVVEGAERVDEDVGQGHAEGISDIETQRILQPGQAASGH